MTVGTPPAPPPPPAETTDPASPTGLGGGVTAVPDMMPESGRWPGTRPGSPLPDTRPTSAPTPGLRHGATPHVVPATGATEPVVDDIGSQTITAVRVTGTNVLVSMRPRLDDLSPTETLPDVTVLVGTPG